MAGDLNIVGPGEGPKIVKPDSGVKPKQVAGSDLVDDSKELQSLAKPVIEFKTKVPDFAEYLGMEQVESSSRFPKFTYVVNKDQISCLNFVHGGTLTGAAIKVCEKAAAVLVNDEYQGKVAKLASADVVLYPVVAKEANRVFLETKIAKPSFLEMVGLRLKENQVAIRYKIKVQEDCACLHNCCPHENSSGVMVYDLLDKTKETSTLKSNSSVDDLNTYTSLHEAKLSDVEKKFNVKIKKGESDSGYQSSFVMPSPKQGEFIPEEYIGFFADTALAMAANEPFKPIGNVFNPTGRLKIDFRNKVKAGEILTLPKATNHGLIDPRRGRKPKPSARPFKKLSSEIQLPDGQVVVKVQGAFYPTPMSMIKKL